MYKQVRMIGIVNVEFLKLIINNNIIFIICIIYTVDSIESFCNIQIISFDLSREVSMDKKSLHIYQLAQSYSKYSNILLFPIAIHNAIRPSSTSSR